MKNLILITINFILSIFVIYAGLTIDSEIGQVTSIVGALNLILSLIFLAKSE